MKTRTKRAPYVVPMSTAEHHESVRKVAEFLANREQSPRRTSRPRRAPGITDMSNAIRDAQNRASTGEWEGLTGRTLIGLFLICHRHVYGFIPAELENTPIFRSACKRAEICYRQRFRDDPVGCVEFIKWAWLRERSRVSASRENGRELRRLRAAWLFSDSFVDDYRLHLRGMQHVRGQKRPA